MYFDEPARSTRPGPPSASTAPWLSLAAILVAVFSLAPQPLSLVAAAAAKGLFVKPRARPAGQVDAGRVDLVGGPMTRPRDWPTPARPKAPSCRHPNKPAEGAAAGGVSASPVGNLYSSTILRPDCPGSARRRAGLRRGACRCRHHAGGPRGAREVAQRCAGRRRQDRRHPA